MITKKELKKLIQEIIDDVKNNIEEQTKIKLLKEIKQRLIENSNKLNHISIKLNNIDNKLIDMEN